MPIQKLYRVRCDCGNYLPRTSVPRPASAVQPDAMLFSSHQDAQAEAKERGWSIYPLLCPECRRRKERQ